MKKLLMLFIGCLIVQSSANAMDGGGYYPAFDRFPLHTAARNGDIQRIEALLASGADVNQPEEPEVVTYIDCQSPLHDAVLTNHLEAVRTLIAHNANVNQTDRSGNTPLHKAILKGYLQIAQTLIDAGSNLFQANMWGETPAMLLSKMAKGLPCY